jgi:glutamyl-tRNA reductase
VNGSNGASRPDRPVARGAAGIRLVGLSHHTAPLEIRERVAWRPEEYAPVLRDIVGRDGVAEGVLVSTCNRSELVAVVDPAHPGESLSGFRRLLSERAGASLDPHLYRFESTAAVEHVFRVTSSLDSLVVGEAQILGQVNDAFAASEAAGTMGPVLDRLFARARQAAKRVRTETGIGEMHVSVASVAVELARKIFGSLAGRSALIVGAGDTSWLTLQHLAKAGIHRALVTNRTDARAERLAESLGCLPVPFEKRYDALVDVDIVITATAADSAVFHRADVARAMAARRHRPIFLIDLAVPRDIEPGVAGLDGVFLYNMDDLSGVVQKNLADRRREADRGRAIVAEEAGRFLAWLETLEVVPTVVALRQRVEAIRKVEEERLLARLSHLSERDREAVRAFTAHLTGKLLHDPTVRLREARDPRETARLIEAARILFALDESDDASGRVDPPERDE